MNENMQKDMKKEVERRLKFLYRTTTDTSLCKLCEALAENPRFLFDEDFDKMIEDTEKMIANYSDFRVHYSLFSDAWEDEGGGGGSPFTVFEELRDKIEELEQKYGETVIIFEVMDRDVGGAVSGNIHIYNRKSQTFDIHTYRISSSYADCLYEIDGIVDSDSW